MDLQTLSTSIFQICIIPLLGVLTTYLVSLIQAKKNQILGGIQNDTNKEQQILLNKYIELAAQTVSNCVIATNQTYVDSLKSQGKFDKEAQEIAFKKTLDAVLAILSSDAKNYLTEVFGDLNIYLTTLIESQVNINK